MFALQPKKTLVLDDQTIMRANFGERPFQYTINALSLNQIIQHVNIKGMDTVSIIEGGGSNAFRDKMCQEEDKLHTSLEKGYFKVSLLPDAVKSFSQFPPSVYRRSFAATRIQRVYRRYRGRKMREEMRRLQVP
jgi:hypothetical protein